MLDSFKILSILSDDERGQLEIFCQKKIIDPGEVLFREGEDATAMYIIGEGQIEISKRVGGLKKVLAVIGGDEMLGEMALFGDTGKRMATATIIERATCITLLSFSIKELTQKKPELLGKIKELIEKRMYENKDLA